MIDLSPLLDPALAYIDPGSGSFLIQVIIGSLLAVPYFLRTQIARALRVLRGQGGQAADEPRNLSRGPES